MSLSFGSAAMLWGLLLVGVPLLIHLLNRRRYVVRKFAAMEFLRVAYQKQKRRMKLENLLLLILRCLVVALAALAMALPFVPNDSILAAVTGGRREVVMIVDRSASMGRIIGPGTTLDDRVLEAVRARLRGLSDERGDAVTLITPGGGAVLPTPIGAQPSRVLEAIESGLPAPSGVADMVSAARVLRDRVRPVRQGRLDVEIYTDMQQLAWSDETASLGATFSEVFDLGGGSLRIVPVNDGLRSPPNLGVVALELDDPLVLTEDSVPVTATVRNHSDQARVGVSGSFYQDGQKRKTVRIESIGPRADELVTFRTRFDVAGPHTVRFELDADDLQFDDKRYLAIDATEGTEVLLVDGRPGGAFDLEGATSFLQLALDPEAGELTPRFRPTVVSRGRFEETTNDLWRYDAIVFADVGGLSVAAADALAGVVAAGTPLMIFTGDNVDGALYEQLLLARGLLPARLLGARGDSEGAGAEDYVTLTLPEPPPRALELFSDPRLSVLLQVPVLRRHDLEPMPESRVLASFADALGETTPAIVEKALGRGRVMLIGTSADDAWTLWPRNPAMWVPLVQELVGDLVAPDSARRNLPVGQVAELVVNGRPTEVTIETPSGAIQTFETPEAERLGADDERYLLALNAVPLIEPGAYRVSILASTAAGDVERTLALAALPDAREGDLRTVDASVLTERLAGVEFELGEAFTEDDFEDLGDEGDGSLARFLLWCLLAALVAESLLARSMGAGR